MLNDSDSEQPANPQVGKTNDNPQSFSPRQLKDVSSAEPQDFELSEGELGEISGGPKGPSWFKLEQAVPEKLDKMGGTIQ